LGRSKAEFIAKLSIVVEESDEAVFWLELVKESGLSSHESEDYLIGEARELLFIFSASRKSAGTNRKQ
jgi:four helix bundle protein